MSQRCASLLILILAVPLGACRNGPTVDVRGEGAEDRREALTRVELDIDKRYASVEHLPVAALVKKREGGERVILIDVREKREFAVAHLPGAVRIAPDASMETIREAVGQVDGAQVVFYCSVGERSSRMARKAQKALGEMGAAQTYNLRGGIFAWHNGAKPLVNEAGNTRYVHPYNDKWGELLVHRDLIATTPQK